MYLIIDMLFEKYSEETLLSEEDTLNFIKKLYLHLILPEKHLCFPLISQDYHQEPGK